MDKTTIQINSGTLERLRSIKKYDRESYDEVLNNLIDEIEEESLSNEEIVEIQKSLEDIKSGRVFRIEQVAREFGIKL